MDLFSGIQHIQTNPNHQNLAYIPTYIPTYIYIYIFLAGGTTKHVLLRPCMVHVNSPWDLLLCEVRPYAIALWRDYHRQGLLPKTRIDLHGLLHGMFVEGS